MPALLSERLNGALNVSGAFDNCFFHAYALHLLANKQPLPSDLFTFKSLIGAESHASTLQKRFAEDPELTLFAHYHQQHNPDEETPSFIVEKTLVLAFLLREWFATKMANTATISEEKQDQVIELFTNYINFRSFMAKEDLTSGAEGVLYLANSEFLEYAFKRSSDEFKERDKKPEFEHYFTDTANLEAALRAFWRAEGYSNYCKYIAQPGTKLSYTDVTPVMAHLSQPLKIYNYRPATQPIIHEHEGATEFPLMELAIEVNEGHYYLLKTEENTTLLDTYRASYNQYQRDREAILAHVGNKVSFSQTTSSLFAGAICPAGHLEEAPFTMLLNRIDDQQRVLHKIDATNFDAATDERAAVDASTEATAHTGIHADTEAAVHAEADASTEATAHIEVDVHNEAAAYAEADADTEAAAHIGVDVHNEAAAHAGVGTHTEAKVSSDPLNTVDKDKRIPLIQNKEKKQKVFNEHLDKLQKKSTTLKEPKAQQAAQILHQSLSLAGKHYFNREITYEVFKEQCDKAIADARPILQTHRGYKEVITNILLIVVSLARSLWNGKMTFFSVDTSSIKKVNAVEEHIKNIGPDN